MGSSDWSICKLPVGVQYSGTFKLTVNSSSTVCWEMNYEVDHNEL